MLSYRFNGVSTLRRLSRCYASHTYQGTLNLPKTKFPSRSNLTKTYNDLIPHSSQLIYKQQLDEFLLKYNQLPTNTSPDDRVKYIKNNLFILHDGPPYANGNLHLGHALNKVIKDIINRFQLSQGKYIYYRPGWDCHGLPIEMKALKKLNNDQIESISPIKIRQMAAKHAKSAQLAQMKQFEKFGILTDWNNPYTTMQGPYEVNQLKIFKKLFDYGLIKRQNKPVFWGTETRTALAESELEYNEHHHSTSAYVNFPLTKESTEKIISSLELEYLNPDSISCLIWTSTPWTLFSNQAICYNEKFNYSIIKLETSNKYIIMASDLIDILKLTEPYSIVKQFEGYILQNLKYTNPLYGLNDNKQYPILNGTHVTNTAGTGLVHTAPGHGQDDYLVGIKNNLPIFSPIDHKGNYDLSQFPSISEIQDLLKDPQSQSNEGRNVLEPETTETVINQLKKIGILYKTEELVHSYPYDWRSKRPIIIRSTPQWFTNLKHLKQLAIESLDKVKFHPKRGIHRLESFVRNRNEWCISRQRSWGVPIPYFQHRINPDMVLLDEEIICIAIKNIEKWGMESWFLDENIDTPANDIKNWLPEKYHSSAHEYMKGKDTMDVWFDSGSSWSTLVDFYRDTLAIKDENMPNPLCDVYLEGTDQHRGWFQSSLLCKVAYNETPDAPYSSLITHGFILDENGIKMSKSIGNVISPDDVIEGNSKLELPALGVDGLRYLVAQTDFTNDITAGQRVMQHTSDALKKVRLGLKFLLGNLQESGSFELLPFNELEPIDINAISKLETLLKTSKQHYNNHNFTKVLAVLQYHLNNDLSAFYFDISKDALYSNSLKSLRRKQIQTTLFHIFNTYRAILTPIIPVLILESWNYLPKKWLATQIVDKSPSLIPWPDFHDSLKEYGYRIEQFEKYEINIFNAFKEQFKEISSENITKPSQTIVRIFSKDILPFTSDEICEILQAARVDIIQVENLSEIDEGKEVKIGDDKNINLSVEVSDLNKCPRCWKHNSPAEDKLCTRCDRETTNL